MPKSAFDVLMSNANRSAASSTISRSRRPKAHQRKQHSLIQMKLDVGQASLASTSCPTCNMVYHKGEPEDDRHHSKYHAQFIQGVDFGPVSRLNNVDILFNVKGRYDVIRIRSPLSDKANSVLRFAYKDLGMDTRRKPVKGEQLYLGISSAGRAIGCALIIPLQTAYVPDESVRIKTEKSHDVRIGVELIWTLSSFRRQRIGSQLLDVAREHFTLGLPIERSEMGFSQPTSLGVRFARQYLECHQLLVY